MSSKEFWEDDPQLYWAYQTFYLKKQEIEFAKDNQYMWLKGMYIYENKKKSNKGIYTWYSSPINNSDVKNSLFRSYKQTKLSVCILHICYFFIVSKQD